MCAQFWSWESSSRRIRNNNIEPLKMEIVVDFTAVWLGLWYKFRRIHVNFLYRWYMVWWTRIDFCHFDDFSKKILVSFLFISVIADDILYFRAHAQFRRLLSFDIIGVMMTFSILVYQFSVMYQDYEFQFNPIFYSPLSSPLLNTGTSSLVTFCGPRCW